ncbi:MAG: prolipoprotein diacylglyceryl transferase [Saprospiraceae bacterium]|jgi:prolipoprotein diacylglyceryl transferase|nr:prolipoprotein diacylglyceryl transferase [Saprospiraceae bacterium]
MTTLAYITWNALPEIAELGPLTLRWYGLLFALGFLLGLFMVRRMFLAENAPEAWLDKCFIYVVAGAVLGARFGHVFFYDWDYYSQHPGEMLKIWEGGLASHGGAIGIILAMWIFSRTVSKKSILWILDKIVVPTALAGGFIRLGNLMNSEIVGKPTDSGIGFLFKNAARDTWVKCEECAQIASSCVKTGFNDMGAELCMVPRHPVQLYESISYFLIFAVLFYTYWKTDKRHKPGYLFGFFLVLIWGVRFVWEYFKMSQGGFESAFGNVLSTGQLLSIPFVLIGLYFMFRKTK